MHIGFHFLGRRDGLPRFHLINLSVSISFFACQSILIKLERTFGVIRRVLYASSACRGLCLGLSYTKLLGKAHGNTPVTAFFFEGAKRRELSRAGLSPRHIHMYEAATEGFPD